MKKECYHTHHAARVEGMLGELNQSHVVLVRGTGSIGSRHLRLLRDRLGLKPIAFPTRQQSFTQLRSEGYEVATNLEEAKAFGTTAAIIATATSRHLADGRELIDAGCHVLIEKPIAVDSQGLSLLSARAHELDRSIFVACCLRFDAGLLLFRERLSEIGRIHFVRIECQSYLPDWRPGRDYRSGYAASKTEGGVLRDLIHEIDYATWIFGRPTQVWAKLQNHGILGIESEESADLEWNAPGDLPISVHLDYLTRKSQRTMRAFGEHGEIEWRAHEQQLILRIAGKDPQTITINADRDEMYVQQSLAFLNAIAGESSGNLASFDDGAFAIALCDAARTSSQSGASQDIRTVKSTQQASSV